MKILPTRNIVLGSVFLSVLELAFILPGAIEITWTEGVMIALFTGLGPVLIAIVGAWATWKKAMADIETAKILHAAQVEKDKEEMNARENDLLDRENSSDEGDDKENSNPNQGGLLGITIRSLVTTLNGQIADLTQQLKNEKREYDEAKRVLERRLQACIDERNRLNYRIDKLSETNLEYSNAIDQLTEQLVAAEIVPVYKKKVKKPSPPRAQE